MFHRFSVFSLVTINLFLLCTLLIQACKKDEISSTHPVGFPALTIEEAKHFFLAKNEGVSARDLTEPTVVPDWENAVSYYDAEKQQSVVEAVLLKSPFSQELLNPENMPVDTPLFWNSAPNHRLIVVKNADNVTDFAIMKIQGTYKYITMEEKGNVNTYQQLDKQFAGVVSYVEVNNRLLSSYYISDGHYHKITSIKTEDKGAENGANDRWELICVTSYEWIPCKVVQPGAFTDPGSGDRNDNPCGRWIVHEYCYEQATFGGSGGGGGNNNEGSGTPPFNPQSGSGGGSGTQSGLSCQMQQVNEFKKKYSIEDEDFMDKYEDLVLECASATFPDANGSGSDCNPELNEDFDECLLNKIQEKMVVESPKDPILDLDERLACFNITNNGGYMYKVSLKVDQPTTNSNVSWSIGGSVGHTFLTLDQIDPVTGHVTTLSVGFYPSGNVIPCVVNSSPGAFGDNGGDSYDVGITWNISPADFSNLVQNMKDEDNPVYNLSTYNCTTWAHFHLAAIGIPIPANSVVSVMGVGTIPPSCTVFGLTPGQLGEDIRKSDYFPVNGGVKDLIGGLAPLGNCF